MKKRYFVFFFAFLLFIGATASTYAFWTFNVENKNNTITVGKLDAKINGADRFHNGDQIKLENLYPSYTYSEKKDIVIENTGTIDMNYKLTFNAQDEDKTIFNNTLVRFSGDSNWYYLKDFQYVNSLKVDQSKTITAYFRLDPNFSDLSYMGKTANFTINMYTVQYEQKLVAINRVNQGLGDTVGAIRLKDFSNTGDGDIYLGNNDLGNPNSRVEANYSWDNTQQVSLNYDGQTGLLKTQVGSQFLTKSVIPGNFHTIQIYMRDEIGTVSKISLTNITINGIPVRDLTAQDGSFYWNITGNIKDDNGGFEIKANLVLDGTQSKGEHGKVEIVFN